MAKLILLFTATILFCLLFDAVVSVSFDIIEILFNLLALNVKLSTLFILEFENIIFVFNMQF